jgi:hypothetical protein
MHKEGRSHLSLPSRPSAAHTSGHAAPPSPALSRALTDLLERADRATFKRQVRASGTGVRYGRQVRASGTSTVAHLRALISACGSAPAPSTALASERVSLGSPFPRSADRQLPVTEQQLATQIRLAWTAYVSI